MNQLEKENEMPRSLNGLLRWMGMSVFVGAVLMGTARRAAAAQTFTVTNLNDSGAGSLRDAIGQANAAAGADTIVFQSGLTGTIKLAGTELAITDSVTITGPGAANLTIDAQGNSRVFNVDDGTGTYLDVGLSGMTITNGYVASGVGGGIYSNENLTIKDCVISNNKTNGDSGGGVGCNSGTLTVDNCRVSGNTTQNGSTWGGGLYNIGGGQTTVTNTVITGNTAAHGGGIGTDGPLTITGCNIYNNHADDGAGIGYGGGVWQENSGSIVIITNTKITDNTAVTRGAGILTFGDTTIDGCTISGNLTDGDGAGLFTGQQNQPTLIRNSTISGNQAKGAGGGIYNASNTLTIRNTKIDNNKADSDNNGSGSGGGIDGQGSIDIDGSQITNNQSQYGGGIHNNGPITITNTVISGNSSPYVGGVTGNNSISISGSNIYNNHSTGLSSGRGGGVGQYGVNYPVTITNTTIAGNTAAINGGGVFLYGTTTITGCTISGNSTDGNGGGVFAGTNNQDTTILNSTISGNSSKLAGGGIFQNGGLLYLGNSTVTLNTSDSDNNGSGSGGGISIGGGTVAIESTIVSGNTDKTGFAPDVGGTVTYEYFSLIKDTTNTTITNAANNQNGLDPQLGPLQNNGGPTLTHAIPAASPAHDTGANPRNFSVDQRGTPNRRASGVAADIGAFEVQDPGQNFVVTNLNDSGAGSLRQAILDANANTNIKDTITFQAGLTGTILMNGGNGEMLITDDVDISGPGTSVITVDGNGAYRIFNVNDGTDYNVNVTISGLTLANAKSGARGGAILSQAENITLDGCVMNSNRGSSGGAICINSPAGGPGGVLTIKNSTLSGNNATGYGGALYCDSGSGAALIIDNSTFAGNSCGSGGGAIITYVTTTITNSTISGNTANSSGGAIAIWNYPTVTLRNTTVSDNKAYQNGGGFYFAKPGTLVLQNCTITKNVANLGNGTYTGGGINTSGGTVTITSTIVAGNTNTVGAPTPDDISGAVDSSSSNNIVGIDTNLSGISNGTLGNQIGVGTPIDPLLGPLQINAGGTVKTHALLVGSPALDKGSNPSSLTTDERGTGFNRDEGPATDVGAFEQQLPVVDTGGPYTITLGNGLILDARKTTDADKDALTYTWDINGDGTFGDATGDNPVLSAMQLTALGITVAGTYNVSLQVSDGFHTVTVTTTLTVNKIPIPPPLISQLFVTPLVSVVNETVTVVFSAQDPNGLPVTITYDWGDGTVNSSNTHIYTTPGIYTITATATNGQTSQSASATIEVRSGRPYTITKLKGHVSFAAPGSDVVSVTTIIPDLPAGFNPAGKTLDVDIGGATASFTLDSKGRAKSGSSSVSLQLKKKNGKFVGGGARLLITLKGALASNWKDEGIDPAKPTDRDSVIFAIKLTFNGSIYLSDGSATLKQTKSSATFHSPHKP